MTNLSGQVVAEYSYDAFGNQLEGEDGWNPFKYCGIFGYREDEEISLMKVGTRYYDPTIGRWIQKDPILSGVNWWLYCENDPVNYVDPEGKRGGASGSWDLPPPPYPRPQTPPTPGYGGPRFCPANPRMACPGTCNQNICRRIGEGTLPPPGYPGGAGRTTCGKGAHLSAFLALALLISRWRRKREDK